MMTNTYLPHVGGVARSVESFRRELEAKGHDVLVVAPTFEGGDADDDGVVRVPAIQNFSGSDFSVRLPIPGLLKAELDRYEPDLVHAHHPFLLGDTALRVAATRNVPLIFTHHTMYERYTHYVPGDSPEMKRFAVRMSTEYANLCDLVLAPSESIAVILQERGVKTPVVAAPTGIDVEHFAGGDRERARRRWEIPRDAFVVGHVGRLAPEKNLPFLADAVARMVAGRPGTRFVVAGDGPSRERVEEAFDVRGLADRLHLLGLLEGEDVVDAYHAMDVFAFASRTETQGIVLAEAMAAGAPVVGIDAPGVREVVRDGKNGRLLEEEDEDAFAAALDGVADADPERMAGLRASARETAERFSRDRCTEELILHYSRVLLRTMRERDDVEDTPWHQVIRMLETEWELWSTRADAAVRTLGEDAPEAVEEFLDER